MKSRGEKLWRKSVVNYSQSRPPRGFVSDLEAESSFPASLTLLLSPSSPQCSDSAHAVSLKPSTTSPSHRQGPERPETVACDATWGLALTYLQPLLLVTLHTVTIGKLSVILTRTLVSFPLCLCLLCAWVSPAAFSGYFSSPSPLPH